MRMIKQLVSILLICSMLLSSCTPSQSIDESEVGASMSNPMVGSDSKYSVDEVININDDTDAMLFDGNEADEDVSDYQFRTKGLGDEAFLRYIEDSVYSDLVSQFDDEGYFVNSIEAEYYPKEYIEALTSNSKGNRYFGYTSDELNAHFAGTKYVFTLGENGQTIAIPMETLTDETYVKAMEDVLVGSGVILLCVTVSCIATPTMPAVSIIFAASASTATSYAVNMSIFSFAAAAIAKAYETENIDQALKAGIMAGAEGFKCGAISGALIGGAKEAFALYKATESGLTMNEVAKIQKESGLPLDLIKQFKSMKEYEIYKEAGLYTKVVNGKLALVRDIDLEYLSEHQGKMITNLERMQKGLAPIDPATGKAYQLHHINQEVNGTLAILTEAEHQGNASILNTVGKEGVHNLESGDPSWDKKRKAFWKAYSALVSG